MRIVQFHKKQHGEKHRNKAFLGLQLPPGKNKTDLNEADLGDIVELPRSLLGLSEQATSIDLIVKWDEVKAKLEK